MPRATPLLCLSLCLTLICLSVQIFSMYLVYDTQIIVGGEHKSYQFDMDDYVLAALVIYLDIINLFILLMQLLQGGRRD